MPQKGEKNEKRKTCKEKTGNKKLFHQNITSCLPKFWKKNPLTWGSRQTFRLNISQGPSPRELPVAFLEVEGHWLQFVRMTPWFFPSNQPINQPINHHITKHQGSHCPTFSGSPRQRVHSHLQRVCLSLLEITQVARSSKAQMPPKDFPVSVSLPLPYHYMIKPNLKSSFQRKNLRNKNGDLYEKTNLLILRFATSISGSPVCLGPFSSEMNLQVSIDDR